MRAFVAWWVQLALAYAVWFLFAGQVGLHEALVGAPAAVLGATLSHVVVRQRIAEARPRAWMLAQAVHVPASVLRDTAQLFATLGRTLVRGRAAGSFLEAVPLDLGPEDDAESAARRAIATTLASITPSTIVLGFDRERRAMIVHRIDPGPAGRMTERLGRRS